MDCSESSNLSNANPSISYQTTKSVETKNADFEENIPEIQIKDNPDVESIIGKEDSNTENKIKMEEVKEITPSELSDPTSTQSFENNVQSLSKESSYKKGSTPSLFNKMTYEQRNQRLLEIILISLFSLLSSNQDFLYLTINIKLFKSNWKDINLNKNGYFRTSNSEVVGTI